MSIAMAATAPRIAQQIRRDREEELIHRGDQYARAVKRYYTKFHRYPANIDQLVNTNGIRFLRKKYVDPFTGKDDWRLVHQGEAVIPNFNMATGPGIQGGQTAQQIAASQASAGTGVTSGGLTTGLGSSSSTYNTPGNPATGAAGASGGVKVRPGHGGVVIAELQALDQNGKPTDQSAGTTAGGSTDTTGATSSSSPSNNSSAPSPQQPSTSAFGQNTGSSFGGSSSTFSSGSSFGQGNSAFGSGRQNTQQGGQSAFGSGGIGGSPLGGQQIGGAAIIGVASTSKEQSIRDFNDKDHYNQWAFIYDPRLDQPAAGQRGNAGVIGTPVGQPGQAPPNGSAGFGGTPATTGTNPPTQPPPQPPPQQPPI